MITIRYRIAQFLRFIALWLEARDQEQHQLKIITDWVSSKARLRRRITELERRLASQEADSAVLATELGRRLGVNAHRTYQLLERALDQLRLHEEVQRTLATLYFDNNPIDAGTLGEFRKAAERLGRGDAKLRWILEDYLKGKHLC